MSQVAKAQEPSMEEILASIRRIIADDEAAKPPEKPGAAAIAGKPAPESVAVKPVAVTPVAAPAPEAATPAPEDGSAAEPMSQDDIDAMLAGFESGSDETATIDVDESVPDPEPESDILELTEDMAVETSQVDAFQALDSDRDIVFAEPAAVAQAPANGGDHMNGRDHYRNGAAMPPPAAVASPAAAQPRPSSAESLLSEQATMAITSSFGSLAHTVLTQNGRTLDDLVQEMLRPMLKAWLDQNLPAMVERLVRAEIERVSRGQG